MRAAGFFANQDGSQFQGSAMSKTLSVRFLSIALLISAGLALSGCGRKGDLETPGQTEPVQKPKAGEKAKIEDRPFILDPLL
ncbi:putative small lipoprotein YifL [Rhizobium sp. SG_E_25_P2]|uniref:LPS translocon maturation chaperone LptM n=1 Tax=Rhizobium sp. SG_E_25_P2 TaxID=2879942 RepID=UPI002474DF7D|nr:lipoprotein [Rhizobium sp. SG_E_25_P2]MDH6267660.1 putative small lipoprotein YifL [Rhizobium sp. SG_E_25_P2]